VAVSLQDSNEPSGLMKGVEFIDQLSCCQFLKEDSDPWSQLLISS
jgi:hypothetical protein